MTDTGDGSLKAPASPALYVTGGGSTVKVAKPRFTIGRGLERDLVLDAPSIARTHAIIEQVGEDFVFVDANTTTGTRFGGVLIKRRRIEHGDEFDLGGLVVRCSFIPGG